MPKQKDFFSKLKEQGKINNAEYDEFLKTLPDAEIPDAVVKIFEDNFLTLDRAAVNKDIHGRIKREVLDPVDNEMNDLFEQLKEYIDPSVANVFNTEQNTYNKVKTFKKIIPEAIKKVKGAPNTDEETKKKLTEYEKTIQDFTDKFSKAEKDYNAQLKRVNEENESKLHDYKLNSELEKLSNKYTLAEAFEETRPHINEVTLSKIRHSNNLRLGEKDGRPVILVLDDDGKPKFNGNSPVVVDQLLDEGYKPFLKRSETETRERVNPTTTTKVTPPTTSTARKGVSTTVENSKK